MPTQSEAAATSQGQGPIPGSPEAPEAPEEAVDCPSRAGQRLLSASGPGTARAQRLRVTRLSGTGTAAQDTARVLLEGASVLSFSHRTNTEGLVLVRS